MRQLASLTLALLLCLLGTSHASAQAGAHARGIAANGLCGLARTAYPTCPKRLGVSATTGYGYTESLPPVDGAHHRLAGSLGVGVVPLSYLALALQLDGRIDLHPSDARGDDHTGTGDPRLFVRAGHTLGRLSLGGEAVVWFPGNDAPSFEPRATTVDLKALLAYDLSSIALLAYAGGRIDQSGASAPDLRRLRPGDRLALGLSDSHAVLLGLGVSARVRSASELFAELSLDWLVGARAPSFARSPLRATLGARTALGRKFTGELSATASLSKRPGTSADDPLVPIEPRVLIAAGLRFGHDLYPPPPVPEKEPEPTPDPPPVVPTTANVRGAIVDPADHPLPDVRVSLRAAENARETVTDGDGTYAFDDVPVGSAELSASTSGFETQRWTLEVTPDLPAQPKRTLIAKGNLGTLRILTRSFTSEPLTADVLVKNVRGRKVAGGKSDASGRYEFDLPPGRYVVMISAPGYVPHRREITIERYGVAILNVDMRTRKR